MFTYVRLKNFLSLGDIVFDFRKKRNPKSVRDVKQFIVIYGENGSGKSNLADSFAFLIASSYAFNYPDRDKEKNWSDMYSMYRTAECSDVTEAEYGILAEGKEMRYKIKFTNRLIEEELRIENDISDTPVFRISSGCDGSINREFRSDIFTEDNARSFIMDEIDKHWGTYTFISLLYHFISKKPFSIDDVNIPDDLLFFAGHLARSCVSLRTRHGDVRLCKQNKYLLEDLVNGTVEHVDIPVLKNTERIINSFLMQAYSEVRRAFYVTRPEKNNNVMYELHIDRIVADRLCRMSFTHESEGVHNSIELLRSIVHALNGELSVCDGIDCGIHDILLEAMLLSAKDKLEEMSSQAEKKGQEFTGQLIFTTHSTQLLNTLDPSDVYLIKSDYRGQKESVCLSSFMLRKRDDIRLKYINGLFDGVPIADSIDYTFAIEQ